MAKMSKRDFLKTLIALAAPLATGHAQALTILEHLQNEKPNSFENDLMKNPRKQILIAEKSGCGFWGSGPAKTKCHAEVD